MGALDSVVLIHRIKHTKTHEGRRHCRMRKEGPRPSTEMVLRIAVLRTIVYKHLNAASKHLIFKECNGTTCSNF